MTNALIIENGVVKNVVIIETEEFAASQGWIIPEPDQAYAIGWTYDGETFSPPTVSFSDAKTTKHAAINVKVETVLSSGFTVPSGPMAGKVLQTRDSTDRINWLVSQASYSAAVAGGAGTVEGAEFRSADNETFVMSYADGLNVLLAMAAWGAACMRQSWTLKDAANAAEDQTALDAIDIEADWP